MPTLQTGSGTVRAPLSERGHDLYETPEEATKSLLAIERVPHQIWEPACGRGAITRVLKVAGHHVYSTDLVDYEHADQDAYGLDFLEDQSREPLCDGIATNPPYKDAQAFAERAVKRAPYVALLMRLAFLESVTRTEFFNTTPLARIHVASRRLPMMHRDGWQGKKSNSAMPFAWFIWVRHYQGPPTISRFDWKDHV